MTKVLTAWLQTMERDRGLPVLDEEFLEDPNATIYLLTPFDGTVAAQAITLMDQLINRQRVKVAQWDEFSRLGMFLDEITNTPLPRLPQYIAESRGLGGLAVFRRPGRRAARRDLRPAAGGRRFALSFRRRC